MPEQPRRVAFADEAYEDQETSGFYVLAAAVFEPAILDEARRVLSAIRARPHARKVHWYEMDAAQRLEAAEQLHDLDGLHVVVVGAPVARRRQERARALCLKAVVRELYGLDVEELHIETRERRLDARDVDTVRGARYELAASARFVVQHELGAAEPAFRAADVIAGAVRTAHLGDATYRKVLGDRLYELEIKIATRSA